MNIIARILSGTPTYVWAIFAGLLILGLRRLRPKRTHIAVAAAAPIGFTAWSLVTISGLAAAGHGAQIWLTAAVAALVGFVSGPFRLVPRPVHVGGGMFDFPATRFPLVTYMSLFWLRYVLQVWGHIDPSRLALFTTIGLALTSLTAGRTLADFLPLIRAARTGPQTAA